MQESVNPERIGIIGICGWGGIAVNAAAMAAVAEDIAKNGTSSIAYAKAKAAMDSGTEFSMKLTDGQTLNYRIIGIDHDDLADGSGKVGLTFEATNNALCEQRMNATDTTAGG